MLKGQTCMWSVTSALLFRTFKSLGTFNENNEYAT